ncbi:MAG TPA: serine/threonine-protein kinase [Polyangiaceae bacterium]|nr:serine/threonine-protein kinase [Polyangiaceae bacterium]
MNPLASKGGGPDRRAPVRPGDLLAGKYRVERVLGVGGMGVVVAAMHEALRQRVALKFLLPELGVEREAVERFAREARAMALLRGEHVARVLDVGTLESGAPYFVMEYLEGEDLARACKRRGPLPAEEAVAYVLQACEALAEAHRAGLIHRDLKPANLFLTRGVDGAPFVKVLDFGVSKVTAGTRGTGFDLTSTSALMGSPRYMAPEQLRDARRVDPRADLWSLGVVLHELLASESPFAAETLPELHVAILQGSPRPLRARRPDLPPALEAAVACCLEKDPARRFPHVAAFAEAIAPFGPPAARATVARIASVLGVAPPTVANPAAAAAQQARALPGAGGAVGGPTSLATPSRGTATLPTPPPSYMHEGAARVSQASGGPSQPSAPPRGGALPTPAPGGWQRPQPAGPAAAPLPTSPPRVVPATLADSPSPALLESSGRASNPSGAPPGAPTPAPAPVPYPFENSWGRPPAPLVHVPPATIAPRGSPALPKAAAAIALIVLACAVSFAGCVVCVGVLGAL